MFQMKYVKVAEIRSVELNRTIFLREVGITKNIILYNSLQNSQLKLGQ